MGSIQVEIQDEHGGVLPGFRAQDCIAFRGDEIEGLVRWCNAPELGALRGRTTRLRFVLRNAKLYSWTIG